MLWKLLWNKVIDNMRKTLLIIGSLFLAMLCTSLLWIVYTNIERFLMMQSQNISYTNTVDLKRKESQGFMVGKQDTNDTQLQQKLLDFAQDPALDKAYTFYSLSLPASATLSIASKELMSDMFIFAVSDNFFADKGIDVRWSTLPIALSKTLLTLYNTQVANATIFPELPEWLLGFMDITISFGKSQFFGVSGKSLDRKARIQTVDPIVPIGFVIPYSAAQKVIQDMNKWRLTPYRVFGFVNKNTDIKSLETTYGHDFDFVTEAEKVRQVQDRLAWVRYFFQGLTIVIISILILFLIYITYSVVEHNTKIFQTLRLHGASDMHILRVLWMEISLYGVVSICLYGLWIVVVDIRALPALSNLVQQQMHTPFVVQNLQIAYLLGIGGGYVLLFIVLGTSFSYPEWSKKFENS